MNPSARLSGRLERAQSQWYCADCSKHGEVGHARQAHLQTVVNLVASAHAGSMVESGKYIPCKATGFLLGGAAVERHPGRISIALLASSEEVRWP